MARKGHYASVRDLEGQMADMYQSRGRGVGHSIYVDTYRGSDTLNTGASWDSAVATMAKALTLAVTGDTIFFRGKIAEECVGSNLKFDIAIVGCLSQHHADQPGSGDTVVDYGSAVWQPPASPTTATPLLKLRGRGWSFRNILFDCPVDASAILMERNALSGLSEYDPSHARFVNCDFRNGLGAIEDAGGAFNVAIEDCVFETVAGVAIVSASTAVAMPRRWKIRNCYFQPKSSTAGNGCHIESPLNGSLIQGNVFGTLEGTALYIDLTGGTGNVVAENVLGGVYDTSDYVGGTGDLWLQNAVTVKAVTAPDGRTLAAPAAP